MSVLDWWDLGFFAPAKELPKKPSEAITLLFIDARDVEPEPVDVDSARPLVMPVPESIPRILEALGRLGPMGTVIEASAVYWGLAPAITKDRPLHGPWVRDRLAGAGLITEEPAGSDVAGAEAVQRWTVAVPRILSRRGPRYALGHSHVLTVVLSKGVRVHENPDPATPAYVAVRPDQVQQAGAAIAKALGKVLGLGEESDKSDALSGPDHWIRPFPNLWHHEGAFDPEDAPFAVDVGKNGLGGAAHVHRPQGACLMKEKLGRTRVREFCAVCSKHLRNVLGDSAFGMGDALALTVSSGEEPTASTGSIEVDAPDGTLTLASDVKVRVLALPPTVEDTAPTAEGEVEGEDHAPDEVAEAVDVTAAALVYLEAQPTVLGATWVLRVDVDASHDSLAEHQDRQLALYVRIEGLDDKGALKLTSPEWVDRDGDTALGGASRRTRTSKGSAASPEDLPAPFAAGHGVAYLLPPRHALGAVGTATGRLAAGELTAAVTEALDALRDPDNEDEADYTDDLAQARCIGISDVWPNHGTRYYGQGALVLTEDGAVTLQGWRTPAASPAPLLLGWSRPGVPAHLDRLRAILDGKTSLGAHPGLAGGDGTNLPDVLDRDTRYSALVNQELTASTTRDAIRKWLGLARFRHDACHRIADLLRPYARNGTLPEILDSLGVDLSAELVKLHQVGIIKANQDLRGLARCRAYLGEHASLQLRMLTRIPGTSAWFAGWAGQDRAALREAARLVGRSAGGTADDYRAILDGLHGDDAQARYTLARSFIDRLAAFEATSAVADALRLSEARRYVASFDELPRQRVAAVRVLTEVPARQLDELELEIEDLDVWRVRDASSTVDRLHDAAHVAVNTWLDEEDAGWVSRWVFGTDPSGVHADLFAIADKLAASRNAGTMADAAQGEKAAPTDPPRDPDLPVHQRPPFSLWTLKRLQDALADPVQSTTARKLLSTLGVESERLDLEKLKAADSGTDFLHEWYQISPEARSAWLGDSTNSAKGLAEYRGELEASASGDLGAIVTLYLQVGLGSLAARADRALSIGLKLSKDLTADEKSRVLSFIDKISTGRGSLAQGSTAHLSVEILKANLRAFVVRRDLEALRRIAVGRRGATLSIERPEVFGLYVTETLAGDEGLSARLRAELVARRSAWEGRPAADEGTRDAFNNLVRTVEVSFESGWLGKERGDDILATVYGLPEDLNEPIEREFLRVRLDELAATRRSWGEGATDAVANTGTELDEVVARVELGLDASGPLDDQRHAELLSTWAEVDTALSEHIEKRAAVAWYANMAATTAAGILATVVTGGLGGGAAVAAVAAAAASGAAALGTRAYIESPAYLTNQEIAEEVTSAAIDGVVGVLTLKAGSIARFLRRSAMQRQLGRGLMSADEFITEAEKLRRAADRTSGAWREIVKNTLEGTVSSGVNSLVMTALDEATWDRQVAGSLYRMALAFGQGAAMGAAFGGITAGAIELVKALPGTRVADAERLLADVNDRDALLELDSAGKREAMELHQAVQRGDVDTVKNRTWRGDVAALFGATQAIRAQQHLGLRLLHKLGVLDRLLTADGRIEFVSVEPGSLATPDRPGTLATTDVASVEPPPPVFRVRLDPDARAIDLVEELVHVHDLFYASGPEELAHLRAMAAFTQAMDAGDTPTRAMRLAAHRARAHFEPKIARHLEKLDVDFDTLVKDPDPEVAAWWRAVEEANARAADESRLQHEYLLEDAEEILARSDTDPDKIELLELLATDPSLTASKRTIADMLEDLNHIKNHPDVVAAGGVAAYVKQQLESGLDDPKVREHLGLDGQPGDYTVELAMTETAARIRNKDGEVVGYLSVVGEFELKKKHGVEGSTSDEALTYGDLEGWPKYRGVLEGPMMEQVERHLGDLGVPGPIAEEIADDITRVMLARMQDMPLVFRLGTGGLRIFPYARAAMKRWAGIKSSGDGLQLHHILALWLGGPSHLDVPAPFADVRFDLPTGTGFDDEIREAIAGLVGMKRTPHQTTHSEERGLTFNGLLDGLSLSPSRVRTRLSGSLGVSLVATSLEGVSNTSRRLIPARFP